MCKSIRRYDQALDELAKLTASGNTYTIGQLMALVDQVTLETMRKSYSC